MILLRSKKGEKSFFKKAETLLDVSAGVLTDFPKIELCGQGCCDIDNFKGLIDFSKENIRVNTSGGIVKISGTELEISVVTDENVSVCGNIKKVEFE